MPTYLRPLFLKRAPDSTVEAPTGDQDLTLSTGLANSNTLGSITLEPGNVDLTVTGLVNANTLGAPTLEPGNADLDVGSAVNTNTLGAPEVIKEGEIAPDGLVNANILGSPTLEPGNADLDVGSAVNTNTLGAPVLELPALLEITPSGIDNKLRTYLGTPMLLGGIPGGLGRQGPGRRRRRAVEQWVLDKDGNLRPYSPPKKAPEKAASPLQSTQRRLTRRQAALLAELMED